MIAWCLGSVVRRSADRRSRRAKSGPRPWRVRGDRWGRAAARIPCRPVERPPPRLTRLGRDVPLREHPPDGGAAVERPAWAALGWPSRAIVSSGHSIRDRYGGAAALPACASTASTETRHRRHQTGRRGERPERFSWPASSCPLGIPVAAGSRDPYARVYPHRCRDRCSRQGFRPRFETDHRPLPHASLHPLRPSSGRYG